ncbi:hypothetical protein DVH05_010401 [Phytophthora capsici]|nr:hypothetical protein DVH05_010401 [Phytophthora capsici]
MPEVASTQYSSASPPGEHVSVSEHQHKLQTLLDEADLSQVGQDQDIAQPKVKPVNYAAWKVPALRKECTNRKLKLPTDARKAERVAALIQSDRDAAAINKRDAEAKDVDPKPSMKRTKHCMFRLLNILFSDEFATRYCQTGSTFSMMYVVAANVLM